MVLNVGLLMQIQQIIIILHYILFSIQQEKESACLIFTGSPGCTRPRPAYESHPPPQPAEESQHGA